MRPAGARANRTPTGFQIKDSSFAEQIVHGEEVELTVTNEGYPPGLETYRQHSLSVNSSRVGSPGVPRPSRRLVEITGKRGTMRDVHGAILFPLTMHGQGR